MTSHISISGPLNNDDVSLRIVLFLVRGMQKRSDIKSPGTLVAMMTFSLGVCFLIRSAIYKDLVTILAAKPGKQQLVRRSAADNNVSDSQKIRQNIFDD